MCGFLGSMVPNLDVIYSQGIWESRPCEPQGSSPFSPGEGQTFSECGLFPRENGGATCEGTARDLILRKREERRD